uniref:Transposable element P transposase-like RNase H C-terminal domain-containing protein n=1 Tax=Knipowitschia caucasica TaxID=637954 RepID=A0AAV2LW01_KNICA
MSIDGYRLWRSRRSRFIAATKSTLFTFPRSLLPQQMSRTAGADRPRSKRKSHGTRLLQRSPPRPNHWTARSAQNIFHDLVEKDDAQCRYLLTYKLSQDHLELFFSSVRARGGFNNNPTTTQFTAAYKRLLVRQQPGLMDRITSLDSWTAGPAWTHGPQDQPGLMDRRTSLDSWTAGPAWTHGPQDQPGLMDRITILSNPAEPREALILNT